MTEYDFVQNRISLVRKYLRSLDKYHGITAEELLTNEERRGAVERFLYLAIQSTIDLAEVLIARSHLRKAQSLAESFEILAEENFIDRELAERLVKMVGFRNLLSHGYHKLDYQIVCAVLHTGLSDIKTFLQEIDGAGKR